MNEVPAPAVNTEVKKAFYPFVDLIRFVSTIGIVFIHTEMHSDKYDFNTLLHHVNHVTYYFWFRQIFKFSTICYFMIAGFLLADKGLDTRPIDYFKRRLNMIAKPYLVALLLFIVLLLIINFVVNGHTGFQFMGAAVKYTMLYTAFWFIPNYFVCLLIILCFSKYLNSLYFGGCLLLVTSAYTYFNVYSQNYTSSHTTALFGFVFYMWLGVFIKRRNITSYIRKANPFTLGAILLAIYLVCNAETYYLFNYTQTHDSLNTLRISNQLYSVAIFVFLVRCCVKAPKFGIFRPRSETYGIYLYHSFFIFFLIPLVETQIGRQYHFSFFSSNVSGILLITLLNFLICYFGTTALVKILLRFKLAYLPSM